MFHRCRWEVTGEDYNPPINFKAGQIDLGTVRLLLLGSTTVTYRSCCGILKTETVEGRVVR